MHVNNPHKSGINLSEKVYGIPFTKWLPNGLGLSVLWKSESAEIIESAHSSNPPHEPWCDIVYD